MRLEVLGSTMGTAAELGALMDLMAALDVRPVVDSTYGFSAVTDAFARLDSGAVFGKVVVDHLH
jgi:D-arabinose 1-dehydrogenase-like Zn-dependent alcohol dehydrogenase